MRVLYSLFLVIFFSLNAFCQIEVVVTKINQDSVTIEFPANMNLEIGQEYQFVFKTNIVTSDSIKESFSYSYLYDGLKVSKKMTHYEQGFNVSAKYRTKRNSYDIGKAMFYVNGTNKWKVSINGQAISRYNSNDITSISTIDIELQSDKEDIASAKYEGPITLYWLRNPNIQIPITLEGNKMHIELTEYTEFMKGYNKAEKYNHLVIALPQVKVKRTKLFSDKQDERMYIMRFLM